MIKIQIQNSLRNQIYKTFKHESLKIYNLFEELKTNPNKGKTVGAVGSMLIRELKYKSFRFYYILDGHELFLFNQKQIESLLIRFIDMSKKNDQQKTIDAIKKILKQIRE